MKQPMYLLFIWGGTSVTGFPAIAGVLAIASIPTDPGIPILAVFFIYCTTMRFTIHVLTTAIGLLFFLLSDYWNICYQIGEFEKLSDYQI